MSQKIIPQWQERTVGRVTEQVKVANFIDVYNAKSGTLDPSEVRSVEVDAIVDTGATHLCLPPSLIEKLGLLHLDAREVSTANGRVERRVFGGGWVTIQGRSHEVSVMENDDSTPPLIGYVVLELLDFVVDPKSQRLIPNPEHEGRWMADLY